MAKGNWKCTVIKPKTRCRYCGYVVKKKDFVRVDGIHPAHESCAQSRNLNYTIGDQVYK